MRRAAVVLALIAAAAPPGAARGQGEGREVVLSLPRPIGAGETAFIEVQLGPIGRAQVEVTTDTGRPLGTIGPFGARAGQDAGTFTLPIPASAIRDGRIALRLMLRQGDARRPPTGEEVRGVKLSLGAR